MVELQKNEGVLLINLGSPKELSKKSVRQYLRVFLSDDNVVDLPKFFQQFILRLFILPFRPKNTLEAYEKIWTKEGSPLIISTESIANKLTEKTGWNVEYAMRYEEPSIEKALHKFKENEINKIYVISLYPHNAMATTVTTELETRNVAMNISNDFELIFTKPFFDNEEYINAMVNSIRPYVENKSYDKIIFSYHGIPKRQAKKTDETGEHCFSTSNCCDALRFLCRVAGAKVNAPIPRVPVYFSRCSGDMSFGDLPCEATHALITALPKSSGRESAIIPGNPLKAAKSASGKV